MMQHIYNIYIYIDLFYFTLANIEPTLHSTLKHMYLLVVAKKPVMKLYMNNTILKPIVEDLLKLVRYM